MAEPSVEISRVEKPHFEYRYPLSGTPERKNAWTEEYKRWWKAQYRREIAAAGDGWLTHAFLGEVALSHHNLPQQLIEAAVTSPELSVSRSAVRQQRLSVKNLAEALAHPMISVFDLFDEENADPDGERKYLDDQVRLRSDEDPNTVIEYIAEALRMAREIVASRKKIFTIT
jgi:hypothetical protein